MNSILSNLHAHIDNNYRKRLSIVIPTFGRVKTFQETIDSIKKQKNKNDFELIVIDNSTDDNALKADILYTSNLSFKYYVNEENLGMFGNWNRGVELSSTDLVTILHDDDLLSDTFSDYIVKCYEHIPEFSICSGYIKVLDQRNDKYVAHEGLKKILGWKSRASHSRSKKCISKKDIFEKNQFSGTLGVVFIKKHFMMLGGFQEGFYPCSDYKFWSDWIWTFGDVLRLPYDVGLYRIAENESLKVETVKGFSKKDNMIRTERINSFKLTLVAKSIANLQFKIKKYNTWVGLLGYLENGKRPNIYHAIKIKFYKSISSFLKWILR